MKNLKGKYCIVTGAGKGIGKAIAKRFLEEEAAGVAILEWNLELAEATAKELDPTGEKVIAIRCNVADSDNVKEAVDAVMAKFGRVDALINNAGVTRDKIFHKMTDDDWYTVLNINLNGVYNLCKFVFFAGKNLNFFEVCADKLGTLILYVLSLNRCIVFCIRDDFFSSCFCRS
jgi:3-oxoacyl-[acyl-carrier protein] reductase